MTNGKAGGLARREKSGMVMAFGDGVVYREHGYAREEKNTPTPQAWSLEQGLDVQASPLARGYETFYFWIRGCGEEAMRHARLLLCHCSSSQPASTTMHRAVSLGVNLLTSRSWSMT